MLVRGWSGFGGRLFLLGRNRAHDTTATPGRPSKQPGWGAESGQREGAHNVHTLGSGSSRMSAGLDRIGHVCGEMGEIQGLEPGSSPTSGTVFLQVRGFLVLFRVDSVHTLASDLMFRLCGSRKRPIRLCGGAAANCSPGTACGDSSGFSSSFVLPSSFHVHHFMVARTGYNMTD